MLLLRLVVTAMLLTGIVAGQIGSVNEPFKFEPVRKIECDVVSVNVEKQQIALHEKKSGQDYLAQIGKSTKLRADKKVMKGDPQLTDFGKGDLVRVVLEGNDNRVTEVRLLKKAPAGR